MRALLLALALVPGCYPCGSADCPTSEPIQLGGTYATPLDVRTTTINGQVVDEEVVEGTVTIESDLLVMTYTDFEGNTWEVSWERAPAP